MVSNTGDSSFFLEALEVTLEIGMPEIFNTGQGVQFTERMLHYPLSFSSNLEDPFISPINGY